MARKSPSLAFEPTPAVDTSNEVFSPLTVNHVPSMNVQRNGVDRRSSKCLRFSPVTSPARRAQSLANTVPFLEPISSASQLPKNYSRIKNTTPHVVLNAYMEQSRSLLESQRLNFDRERDMFEKERKLWNAERAMLMDKIAELELNVNKNGYNQERRRFSNDASSVSAQSFRKDFGMRSSHSSIKSSQENSESDNAPPPVWQTPDMGAAVTRVFSNEEQQPQTRKIASISNGLPIIVESATEKPLSPRSIPVSGPVSAARWDSSLDGINLKSAALESSFVKVYSPKSPRSTSPPQPPSPGPRINHDQPVLHMSLDGLRSPFEANLVRNAGHTPMEFNNPDISTGQTASTVDSRRSPPAEAALALKREQDSSPPKADQDDSTLAPPARPPMPPSERSDSYFFSAFEQDLSEQDASSPTTANADVELRGPLAMNGKRKDGQDDHFLDLLDAKLLAESQAQTKPPPPPPLLLGGQSHNAENGHAERDNKAVKIEDEDELLDDGGPRLKLKKSMNFGSVFGSKRCGNI
ncbi:hypothetical protein HC762_01070 [bacterium]|nr:hypothetical protein [bacterium]